MACSEDQKQSNFKHFCRVCRKGFMCGRALGGHMRAHGIGDESGNIDEEEDPASDWEDKVEGSEQNSNKRMYSLRTNPNRLKSCRVCENCGKEFLSWKSFLEHGKCSSEDGEESLVSYPYSENDDDGGRKGFGWFKRKRSFRVNVGNFNSVYSTSEDDDISLAKCLMSLSNARVDSSDMKPEESHTSTSRNEERRNITSVFLPPLSRIPFSLDKAKGVAKGMFECKACKKVFNSHQALGGHRASHKKVKGCFATQGDPFDDNLADDDVINYTHEEFFPSKSNSSFQYHHSPSVPLVGAARRKSKVHECSICHRVFSSGQALGGHKRCHWLTSNSPDTSSPVDKYHHQFHDHNSYQRPHPPQYNKSDPLDLNFPAPANDIAGIRGDPPKPLSFEVSTEINLQSWVDLDIEDGHQQYQIDDEDAKNNNNKNNIDSMQNVDDEADSKVKLAKLSEFKDINISGTSSPWLQVGIGSTTDNGANKP